MGMAQLTLRGVPDEVQSELKRRALSEGLSMNRLAVKILREGLERGAARGLNERRDLSAFVGIWSEEEADAFDEVLADIRQFEGEAEHRQTAH